MVSLVNHYSGRVASAIRNARCPETNIDDLLQQVFCKFYDAAQSVQIHENPEGYLNRAALPALLPGLPAVAGFQPARRLPR